MILILSNKHDITVDFVVRLLRRKKKKFLRLNTEDLISQKIFLTIPEFSFKIEKKGLVSDLVYNLESVWFRRPGKPFEFISTEKCPSENTITFVKDQWHSVIESIKHIDDVFWINDPDNNHMAENKIFQLKLAHNIGFKIPETCITNDKEHAMRFLSEHNGKIIAKALSCPLIEGNEKDYFIFTNIINSINNVTENEFSISPTIFQEYLNNKIDYRVTIIGDDCFSVKVARESNNGINEDWRIIKDGLRFQPSELPYDVKMKCVRIVRELGLVFGAIDLIQVEDEFFFLEINPNGEWAWLQKESKLPIAETLVENLLRGDKKN